MSHLELTVAAGHDLKVRRFVSEEALSSLYTISVWARTSDPALDLGGIAGQPASFLADGEGEVGLGGHRQWSGIVSFAQQIQADPTGLSTYFFRIVPKLWLLTERRNHRIFQHLSIPRIIDKLLEEWGVEHEWAIEADLYPPLEYKVQWGESDYTFFCRLLEEAGITFLFQDPDSKLLLTDAPEKQSEREDGPLQWVEQPSRTAYVAEYVTNVGLGHEVRPGAYTLRDYDYRRPAFTLFGEATPAPAPEDRYEQYHYGPGSMAIDMTLEDGQTPFADDRGWVRHDDEYGEQRAERGLAAERAGRRAVSFDANFLDLPPGMIFSMLGHPHDELGPGERLLVTELTIECEAHTTARVSGRTAFASAPWKPHVVTPKPRIRGVNTAIVVGPPGDEIAPDEFGRVRVQFPWDREGTNDEFSSCWMHVAQPWGGLGYGMQTVPRVGQEVLVDFLEGDPDRPLVVGRVFDATQPVPYKLPDNKTISTWKSDSSLGSGGFNEILYEDKAGQELVYIQAERNMRKLVKNDETITVGHDRKKHVLLQETDTTAANRTEITLLTRTQVDGANRIAWISGDKVRWVKIDRTSRTEDVHMRIVSGDHDAVTKKKKRERIEEEVHLAVLGERREEIDGKQSITIFGERHEKVKGEALFEAGETIHLLAKEDEVFDGRRTVTIKTAGGFVQVDASGVTIVGNVVKINAGGSPGSAPAADPDKPEDPEEALVDMPELPEVPKLPPPPPSRKRDDKSVDREEDTAWIEIVLVDEDEPEIGIPFARYRLELPNGKVLEGRLNDKGRAMVTGIKQGECKITFPDHHQDNLHE